MGACHLCGQTREVNVHILRNPDTVEARIWNLLDAKLTRIQTAGEIPGEAGPFSETAATASRTAASASR